MPGSRSYASTVVARARRPLAPAASFVRRAVAPLVWPVTTAPVTASSDAPSVVRGPEVPPPTAAVAPAKETNTVSEEITGPAIFVGPPSAPIMKEVVRLIPGGPTALAPKVAESGPQATQKARGETRTIIVRDPASPVEREISIETLREEVPVIGAGPPARATEARAIEPHSFRMRWPEKVPPLPSPVRERVEREVARAARTEWRKSAERRTVPSSATAPSPPVVEVRVEQVTVKIEAPPQHPTPLAPPASAPAPRSATDEGFSSHFLRRSISNF